MDLLPHRVVFSLILPLRKFATFAYVIDGFSLESERHQVSEIVLSILVDLNITLVWMFSTLTTISKSASPSTNSLVVVPSAPTITGITVIFMFYSFFSILLQVFSTYLSFCFLSVLPTWHFFNAITRSGRLAVIR